MKEVTITIVAHGDIAVGKTRAVNQMVDALKQDFEVTAQMPRQMSLSGIETYTFKARLR